MKYTEDDVGKIVVTSGHKFVVNRYGKLQAVAENVEYITRRNKLVKLQAGEL
jgi:hypothetical protein